MSLTSYRAAPPRVGDGYVGCIGRPGGDLLSHVLRRSTMGAGGFHGRVRDGIGCSLPAKATRSSNAPGCFPVACVSRGRGNTVRGPCGGGGCSGSGGRWPSSGSDECASLFEAVRRTIRPARAAPVSARAAPTGGWMIAAHDGKSHLHGGSDRLGLTLWDRADRAIRTG